MGPTYNRDDLKTGTVFDAEDHGEHTCTTFRTTSKPPPGHPEYNISQGGGNDNNNNTTTSTSSGGALLVQ